MSNRGRLHEVVLASLGVIVLAAPAPAAIRYLVNFDHGVQSPGPATYTASGGEILPAGITGNNLTAGDTVSGTLVNPPVAGPQGGQAFEMMRGASWPNQQGIRFGEDNNGGFAGTTGPVIDTSWTIEAYVRPDFVDKGFGLTQNSQIFNSQQLGDGSPWGDIVLSVNQNNGIVTFLPNGQGLGDVVSTTALQAGQWSHVAAVVRNDSEGTQQIELWINGVLNGTGTYPEGWESLNKIPGYFNLGSWYWTTGRNFQGYIDAFAISDTALNANSFVLIPEPATGMLLAAVGPLALRRRRN